MDPGRQDPCIPSVYPASPRSRRQQRLSDEDHSQSNESRIDSNDRFRVGGPGALPEWPVSTAAPSEISAQLSETLTALAANTLSRYGIDYERILIVKRYSCQQDPAFQDNTLYIVTPPIENTNRLVLVADDIIVAAGHLGFTGRVELIDTRATGGLKSYPPRISDQLKQSWATIEQEIIARLTALNVGWKLIHLARRGYWEDAAVETAVINASVPSRAAAIALSDTITHVIKGYGIEAEICRSDFLWGVFSTTEHVDPSTPGCPFTRTYNAMGISTGRSAGGITGTLGGYLTAKDKTERQRVLGLTCYHILRDEQQIDYEMQTRVVDNINIPFSSPSPADIETAKQQTLALRPNTPEQIQSLPPFLRVEAETQEANKTRKLAEINSYNPNIGAVIGTSDWRDTPINSTTDSPLTLQDWAVILMADGRQSANYIADYGPPASVWNPTGSQASRVVPFDAESENTQVVKRGRSTGITSGVLTTICPAYTRINGLPAGLPHRVWTMTSPSGFAAPGDSGSWVLNSAGQVLGLLIGGNWANGTGLVLPMALVIEDIEKRMDISKGGLHPYVVGA